MFKFPHTILPNRWRLRTSSPSPIPGSTVQQERDKHLKISWEQVVREGHVWAAEAQGGPQTQSRELIRKGFLGETLGVGF